eukprot:XP_017169045.1 PREDICTED: UPF0686 protein C11orf1 homolog isoform X2 [Mus musculus]
MAQRSRALAASPENRSSIPSTHRPAHTYLSLQFQWTGTLRQTCRQTINTGMWDSGICIVSHPVLLIDRREQWARTPEEEPEPYKLHLDKGVELIRDKTLSVILETHTMAALFMLMVMEKCGQTGMTCPSFYSTDGDAPLMRTPIRTVPW